MLKFSLAGYYSHYKSNMALLVTYRAKREWFFDDIEIDSVFGCLPATLWSGCRIIAPNNYCNPYKAEIYDLRDDYYSVDVNLRHTYTNGCLTPEMFLDYRCLEWTRACEKPGNSIILVDPNLKEFLHERFPQYSFIWSTSLCLKDIDKINELSKEDMVVLDYTFNYSNKFEKLKHPENIEVMLSEACRDNCPYRSDHYNTESKIIINDEKTRHLLLECKDYDFKRPISFYDLLKDHKATLNNEQIRELNSKYNLTHFKIAGRDYSELNYIESLMYYLVKPEYRDHLRILLLREVYGDILKPGL